MIAIDLDLTGFDVTAEGLQEIRRRIPGVMKKALKRQALRLRSYMQLQIRRGGIPKFKPLAESTKKRKKSSKPLIDKGDLIRSINVDMLDGGNGAFVGVNRQVRNRKGNRLENIAEFHEFGTKPFQIPVTAKMRWWWYFQFKSGIFKSPLKPTTTVINHPGIPKRPFIVPAFDIWKKDINEMFTDDVVRGLKLMKVKLKAGGTLEDL